MAVHRPSTRAKPEDKVGLHCHKSQATGLYYIYFHLIYIYATCAKMNSLSYFKKEMMNQASPYSCTSLPWIMHVLLSWCYQKLHPALIKVSTHNSASTANDACSGRAPPCNHKHFSEFIGDKELAELSKGLYNTCEHY